MRIGLVGPTDPDSFAENIGDTLTRLGHTVDLLGAAKPVSRYRPIVSGSEFVRQAFPALEFRAQRALVRRAVEAENEIVISTDSTLAPEAVTMLRNNGVRVGLWFPDCVANVGRMRMFAAPYNAFFLKDELLVRRLRDLLGLPAWYVREACNPSWHRPIGSSGTDGHIAVVGNTYITRLRLLERLHSDGIPIVIYGSPFPRFVSTTLPASCHMGRSVHREEKSKIFRQAAGVLNNLHPAEMTSVNARLFEATAAGAAVLCENRPSLAESFDVGQEVLAFSHYDELVEMARGLLDDRSRVTEIGDSGSKRAHAEHSYEVRLKMLLEKLA
jgi:spore maturation protein CgeB